MIEEQASVEPPTDPSIPLTPQNLQLHESLIESSTRSLTAMPPPPEPHTDEARSPLEDSAFELISNPGVLSDDEGHTVSVASQSIDGDTADDFSDVNSLAGDSEDEDAAATDDEESHPLDTSSHLAEPSSSGVTTMSTEEVEDSGMTTRPVQVPFPRSAEDADHLYHSDSDEDMEEAQEAVFYKQLLSRNKNLSLPRKEHVKKAADSSSTGCIWDVMKKKVAAFTETRAGQRLTHVLSLPWLWVIVLSVLNVTVIYGITSHLYSNGHALTLPGYTATSAPWTAGTTATTTVSTTVSKANPTVTPARTWTDLDRKAEIEKMWKHFQGEMEKEVEKQSKDKVRKELEKAEKDMERTFLNVLTSALPQKPFGRTLDSSFSEGEGFRLISYGQGSGFWVILPPSLLSKDPAISVTASRKETPLKLEVTKLRRGFHYVQVASDDAHGNIDFVITTTTKPFKYQRQRIHFGSSWLPQTIQPSKWAADAANKMVEVFRGDVLAPMVMTRDLAVQFGANIRKMGKSYSRGSKQLAESTLQRLDATAKRLIKLPHRTWANTLQAQHELLAAQKRMSEQISKKGHFVAKKISHNARVLQNEVEQAYMGLYNAMARHIPQADLTLPLKNPQRALKNAQGNVQDLLGKLTTKSEKRRAAKLERKAKRQELKGERKERRKAGRR
jgi:hypothetical protein